MGSIAVDQLNPDGSVTQAPDRTLTEAEKNSLLVRSLPGAYTEVFEGTRVVRWGGYVLLKKQITHLGQPWPGFKKRIQIPRSWVDAYARAREQGLVPRFIGIYQHDDVTVFVDFDPGTFVRRKANNSAAHVATNDLFQAQVSGTFTRRDTRDNVLTSVRADQLASYLSGLVPATDPRLDVFGQFNEEFIDGARIEALEAVKKMHNARWADAYQAEWAGFYLEFRLDEFLRRQQLLDVVEFQRVKAGGLDFDLVFRGSGAVEYYGDLKASSAARLEAPGNDADDLKQCVKDFGRFWYVIYEHETWHSKHNGDRATIAWNDWRYSIGRWPKNKAFDRYSYASKFKEAVRFQRMLILEVNAANFHVALGDFRQGRQQRGGGARAPKVKIKKRDIDNFLVYSSPLP